MLPLVPKQPQFEVLRLRVLLLLTLYEPQVAHNSDHMNEIDMV